ncbi:hypothetical protein B0T21DRAFT_447328 [Apiosordaria backusii]|uniref:Uncharacterized protein n=1 Tax=Apiosordaria backusii TaxID=314023 RepID=A0AA40F017_9PEZI|nr:hypothetical protein B0T21DRAFT_447328 [Apiosordaria backusii]
MTSPTSGFAPDAGRGPIPTTGTGTAYNTAAASYSSNSDAVSPPAASNNPTNRDNVLHAHRQNHNSSKLPAFRFADLKRDPMVLPSLIPLLPSPHKTDNLNSPPGENHQNASATSQQAQARRIPGLLSRENLHQISSTHNLSSDKPVAFETPLPNAQNSITQQPVLTKTRSLKFQFPSTATATATANTIAPASTTIATTATSTATTTTAPAIATSSPNSTGPSTVGTKRPASFPDAPRVVGSLYANKASQLSYVATPVTKRRLTASAAVQDTPSSVPRPSPSFTRLRATESGENGNQTAVPESTTKEWAQSQRDLLLPKEGDDAEEPERKKPRPPSSYKPPASSAGSTSGGRAIPPIRGFRSSVSRKSVVIDMRDRRLADSIYGQESSNSNQRDKTLRALEGRTDDDFGVPQETGDMTTTTDNDNTADLFLRIASETSTRRVPEFKGKVEDPSAVSRITRISHRRPLSTAIATFQANSPPQLARRLSDQRETTRSRQRAESNTAQQMTRELAYRTSARDKLNPITTSSTTTITTTEDPSPRTVSIRTPLKPSPITPRTIQFQDTLSDSASAYQRRRQSLTTNNDNQPSSARAPQYRSSNLAQSRIYNSSPLVPKPMIPSKDDPIPSTETNHGVEGNESSSSTAAPSTVWDELDDLKSRINRLELTGKMPSSSGAAMSRTSDDNRPPTATTNATTMSASPKRGSGASASQPNVNSSFTSNTSSHRGETQPLLISALNKTKGLVGSEAFSAMESAANDVLALTSMLGTSGQPGPISSGASAIGYGSNNGSVTDRQLRRKADGICRSLTELYIALADELAQKQGSGSSNKREREEDGMASPTSARRPVILNPAAAASATSRRQSAVADTITPLPPKSPRAPTSLEVRRQSMLAASSASTAPSAASQRYAAVSGTPVDSLGAGRKSSLLLGRARRAGTEEPEELSGRRSSLLLRTRRATTEEPEDQPQQQQQQQQSTPGPRTEAGRKTSLLLRTRKTMNDVDDLEGESRFRTPSRAVTEVNSSFRSGVTASAPRESARSPPDLDLPTGSSSALPRRRLVPSSLNARLIIPAVSASGPTTPIPRRYLERATPMRDSTNGDAADKIIIEEGQRGNQRQFLQLSSGLGRSNSLNGRRAREGSGIPMTRESRVELLQGQQGGREREYR